MSNYSQLQLITDLVNDSFEGYCLKEDDKLPIAKCIFSLYSTEYRKYHSVCHLEHIFSFAKSNNVFLSSKQKIAILFHDIIYVPGRKDNESLSAQFCESLLTPFIPADTLKSITNIVRDTSEHFNVNPKFSENESRLVLDLDISSMSLDYENFLKWNKLVEEEFAPFGFNDISKRIQFFDMFLSKEKIVQSIQMSWMEAPIRENLKRYIKELKG